MKLQHNQMPTRMNRNGRMLINPARQRGRRGKYFVDSVVFDFLASSTSDEPPLLSLLLPAVLLLLYLSEPGQAYFLKILLHWIMAVRKMGSLVYVERGQCLSMQASLTKFYFKISKDTSHAAGPAESYGPWRIGMLMQTISTIRVESWPGCSNYEQRSIYCSYIIGQLF